MILYFYCLFRFAFTAQREHSVPFDFRKFISRFIIFFPFSFRFARTWIRFQNSHLNLDVCFYDARPWINRHLIIIRFVPTECTMCVYVGKMQSTRVRFHWKKWRKNEEKKVKISFSSLPLSHLNRYTNTSHRKLFSYCISFCVISFFLLHLFHEAFDPIIWWIFIAFLFDIVIDYGKMHVLKGE